MVTRIAPGILACCLISGTALAEQPKPAPKLPRLVDVARLTFVATEGGPSLGQCKAFEQRLVIDLARNRWTHELCLAQPGQDRAKRTRETGALLGARRDEIAALYAALVTETSNGCAKDAGDLTLTITRKRGAAMRFYSASSTCPPRFRPVITTLESVFPEMSTLATAPAD